MDGNRTEKPTLKKIKDSRRKGKVAKSSDLSGSVVFGMMILILFYSISGCLGVWVEFLRNTWSASVLFADNFDIEVSGLILKGMFRLLAAFFLPVGLLCGLVVFLQVGPLYVPMKADVTRVSPAKGMKSMFSMKKVVDLMKMLSKFFAVLVPVLVFGKKLVGNIVSLTGCRPGFVFESAGQWTGRILLWAVAVFVVFGVWDYWLQYRRWYKDLMMKRHEVQKEMKESEGDPLISSMRRQMYQEIASSGLEERVSGAGIVVVNPTSFAVALEYDACVGGAPRVLAKGSFEHAAEIRRLAKKHNIPVVRHPLLARQLFVLLLDQEIPEEYFRAVAELLIYVIGLTDKERRSCR